MIDPEALYASPNALAPDYREFRVAERLLLTGHSHQAWPDCTLDGQLRAWRDAAARVDAKWERAFAVAARVAAGFLSLLDDPDGDIALGQNTHELVVRWLSALPLGERPRLVTTDGEFHSIRRQLDRLAEAGIEIVKVPAEAPGEIAERLIAAVDSNTAAVLVSAVLFQSGRIVPGLGAVLDACQRHGAELLVDAYHALDVVPFSLVEQGLTGAYVVGGGYKYCQLGEGNCFLRLPADCALRPVVTGWYAEFGALAAPAGDRRVEYAPGGARFAGATYDPTSHYRAAAAMDFFVTRGLTPALLRAVSQHQVGLLADRFDRLDLDPAVIDRDRAAPLAEVGGFLVLRSPRAAEIRDRLSARGVVTDVRGDRLRMGPAPYLCDAQLEAAMAVLGEVVAG